MKKSSFENLSKIQKESEPQPTDYLMWVGSMYYPTVDTYIRESKRRGICKRLGKLPSGLVPGKSRVFLAHDDGLVGDGFIFGYFVPSWLEYLAVNEIDVPYQMYDRVTWVNDWSNEEPRECGYRSQGLYVVAHVEDESMLGHFKFFKYPRILEEFDPGRTHFRGMLAIDYGDDVIDATHEQVMTPPSRILKEPKEVSNKELVRRIQRSGNMSRTAQEIAYETGSTKASVVYRYLKLIGKIHLKGDRDE
jgi:hypothetical protein